MSDIQQQAVESAIVHWPLGVALVATLLAFGRWGMPLVLTKFFKNGGGVVIGGIVDSKLREQDDRNQKKMEEAFREHEKIEDQKVALALKAATLEAHTESQKIVNRLERIEQHLNLDRSDSA